MKKLLFILTVLGSLQLQAQDVEQQIKQHMDRIQYWRYEYSPEDSGVNPNANPHDSVLMANKMLMSYLQKIGNDPGALRLTFKILDDAGMKIATSDDKRMRIYSWDTETGEDTHIYNAIAQYEISGGSRTRILNDIAANGNKVVNGYLYNDIYSINGNRKYYLAMYNSMVSTKDAIKGARTFVVESGQLNDAAILQGKNEVNYTYDYSANYDFKKMKENYVLFWSKGSLNIPAQEGDKLNGKWQVYTFDGDKFIYNAKN